MIKFAIGVLEEMSRVRGWLAVILIVVGAADARAQGNVGSNKGRLVWGGNQVPAPRNLVEVGQSTKDPQVCAKDAAIPARDLVVDSSSKGVRYGFAYLVKPQGENPDAVKALLAKTPQVVIDQKNCEFIPYVTAMIQDQPLTIRSSEPVNHNVRYTPFSPTNTAFNQILPPNGQVEVKLVAERRPIQLNCDIHPWMKGYLMVFDHPYFAITQEDGSFEIVGVPAGEQKLVVWQEKVGYVTEGFGSGKSVAVQAGKVTDVGAVTLDPSKVK